MIAAYAALFGLAFGSFANAAIDRIPRGISLAGRSHCDACGLTLTARHLVPLVSYVIQRGRCADCRAPIGLRTPVVEAGCAVAFVAAFSIFSLPAALAVVSATVAAVIAAGAGLAKRKVAP
jgi:leader peptidase (prepilin peptidase)/N-methyltransferase